MFQRLGSLSETLVCSTVKERSAHEDSVEAEHRYRTVRYSEDVSVLTTQAMSHDKHFLHSVTSTPTLPIIVLIKTSRNICYKEKKQPFLLLREVLSSLKKLFQLVWCQLASKAASIVLPKSLTSDEDLLSMV
jgi:hypothetical protein